MLIFRVLGGLCNLIMVNLLFLATSLPIITIGASLTGLCRVTLKMVRHEEPSVVKDYFDVFKKHFKESTLTWLLVLFAGAFLTLDLYVIFTKIDASYKLLQIPVWIFVFIVASIFIYSFPMISAYPDKVKRTWKNAILISISHFPVTIFAVVIPLLVAKLAVKDGEWLVGVFSIMLFFGCALLAYINCFFINHIFLKLTGELPEEDLNDDPVPAKAAKSESDTEETNASADTEEAEAEADSEDSAKESSKESSEKPAKEAKKEDPKSGSNNTNKNNSNKNGNNKNNSNKNNNNKNNNSNGSKKSNNKNNNKKKKK